MVEIFSCLRFFFFVSHKDEFESVNMACAELAGHENFKGNRQFCFLFLKHCLFLSLYIYDHLNIYGGNL